MKKQIIFFAVILLFVLFSGCKIKTTDSGEPATSISDTDGKQYEINYIAIPDKQRGSSYQEFYDNKIYLCSPSADGGAYVYVLKADGKLENTITLSTIDDTAIRAFCIDYNGGFWVLYQKKDFMEWIKGNALPMYLIHFDSKDNKTVSHDISILTADYNFQGTPSISVDSDGTVYLSNGDTDLFAIAESGDILFHLESSDPMFSPTLSSEGTICLISNTDPRRLLTVEKSSKSWGKTIDSPANSLTSGYDMNGKYSFYYISDSTFYGYNLMLETEISLFSIDFGPYSYKAGPWLLDDGSYVVLLMNSDPSSSDEYIALIQPQ